MNAILLGLALGAVFGAAARAGRFCLLRGIKGLVPGNTVRCLSALRAFALAIAVAPAGTQALNLSGGTDLSAALPLRAGSPWPAMLIGGAISSGLAWCWPIPAGRGRWCCWRAATCGR